jgi:hypothetical protein
MSFCHVCWQTGRVHSTECASCAFLTVDARMIWLLLDDLLQKPPFRVWSKGGKHRRGQPVVQQPGQVAWGTCFGFMCAGCFVHPASCAPFTTMLYSSRPWLYVGDIDDARKVAAGECPHRITHIICLCPEHLQNDERDTALRQDAAVYSFRVTCSHLKAYVLACCFPVHASTR